MTLMRRRTRRQVPPAVACGPNDVAPLLAHCPTICSYFRSRDLTSGRTCRALSMSSHASIAPHGLIITLAPTLSEAVAPAQIDLRHCGRRMRRRFTRPHGRGPIITARSPPCSAASSPHQAKAAPLTPATPSPSVASSTTCDETRAVTKPERHQRCLLGAQRRGEEGAAQGQRLRQCG